MLVMVPLVFLVNGFTKGDWLEAFLLLLQWAFAQHLKRVPIIVTIRQGAMAMASKKVIVKRLNSIQNLGAMECPVHGQDRHADPGQKCSSRARRCPR